MRSSLLAVFLLLAILWQQSDAATYVYKRTQARIAGVSDIHSDTNTGIECYALMPFLSDLTPPPEFVLACGDNTDGGWESSPDSTQFHAWARINGLDAEIPILPVPGNWDPNTVLLGSDCVDSGNPYSHFISTYPDLMSNGVPWYSYTIPGTSISMMVMWSNPDTLNAGDSLYGNCNALADSCNMDTQGYAGDFGGINIAGSPQRQWITSEADRLTGSGTTWLLGAWHRPCINPIADATRPINHRGRPAAHEFAEAGGSVMFQGDHHVNALTKRFDFAGILDSQAQVQPADSVGLYFLTTTGGYVNRTVTTAAMPNGATDLYYSKTSSAFDAFCWTLDIIGDVATLKLYENTDGVAANTVLRHTRTLYRNGTVRQ